MSVLNKTARRINRKSHFQAGQLGSYGLLPRGMDKKPLWNDWSTGKAVRDGYKASVWVYAIATAIAEAISSVNWFVKPDDPDSQEMDFEHPAAILLRRPNEHLDGQTLIERLVIHLLMGGNGIWRKIFFRGQLVELWPVMPDDIHPIPSQRKFLEGYQMGSPPNQLNLKPEEVFHLMYTDPANMYWGMGPLQAAAKTVDSDLEAVNWNKVALQNRAVTDGAFTFKQPLTREQWEEARQMVREQYAGDQNARTPWVLGSDADWKQISLSPTEMDFIESRKLTRVEICGVFRIPPPIVGIYDMANYKVETARKIFWLDLNIPLLKKIASALNRSVMPHFGEGLKLWFDLTNVDAIQETLHEKVEMGKELHNMGVPFDLINKRLELGIDAFPGSNESFLPANLLPAGILAGGDAGADPLDALPSGDEAEEDQLRLPAGLTKALPGSDHAKAIYWKSFENLRVSWYARAQRRMERLLEAEKLAVAEGFLDNDLRGAMEAIDGMASDWEQELTRLNNAMIDEFGTRRYDELTKRAGKPQTKQFNPFSSIVQNWVEDNVGSKVRLLGDASKRRVRDMVSAGIADRLPTGAIAQNLEDLYDRDKRHRGARTARTEVVAASNAGNHFGARESGVVRRRVWVSSRDSRVREDHDDADGQEVGLDEPFIVMQEQMMFPGDPNGSAKNVIHCRCVEDYVVGRDGDDRERTEVAPRDLSGADAYFDYSEEHLNFDLSGSVGSEEDKMYLALSDYKDGLDQAIHARLRHGVANPDLDETIARLDQIFSEKAQGLPEPIQAFRGADMPDVFEAVHSGDDSLIGWAFEDESFMSTSSSQDIAAQFAKYTPDGRPDAEAPVVFHITLPEGSKAVPIELFDSSYEEQELLLNRGVKLQITGMQVGDDGMGHVWAEAVSGHKRQRAPQRKATTHERIDLEAAGRGWRFAWRAQDVKWTR